MLLSFLILKRYFAAFLARTERFLLPQLFSLTDLDKPLFVDRWSDQLVRQASVRVKWCALLKLKGRAVEVLRRQLRLVAGLSPLPLLGWVYDSADRFVES